MTNGPVSSLAALLVFALHVGFAPSTNAAAPTLRTDMTGTTDCTILFDFTRAADRDAWGEQNDTVMGGNSRGRIERTDSGLVFAGDLVTRDGGFVQMQARLPDGALTGMTGLRLVASGDGRPWRVRITTDTRVARTALRGRDDAAIGRSGVELDGPRVAFAAPVRNLGQGDPAPATVSMANPDPSVRGCPVPEAVWEASRARSMGFILSDGRDAPFRLTVRRIEVCRG